MKFYLLLFISLNTCFSFSQKKKVAIAFYNVENLFDTIKQSRSDNSFLPDAKYKWNSERYLSKITKINQVLDSLDPLALVGLAEVENKQVLEDLNQHSSARKDFQIIHYDGKDPRGIDVAFLYDPKLLTLVEHNRFQAYPQARDILWAKFQHKTDTLLSIVSHWPSRIKGEEKTAYKRIEHAKAIDQFLDSIQQIHPSYKYVVMGDFNDTPKDSSVQLIEKRLIPLISKKSGPFGGSYNYQGKKWQILDHLFVSSSFFKGKMKIVKNSGTIVSSPFLLKTEGKNIVPHRNFKGEEYQNGYSDHLPVLFKVKLK